VARFVYEHALRSGRR